MVVVQQARVFRACNSTVGMYYVLYFSSRRKILEALNSNKEPTMTDLQKFKELIKGLNYTITEDVTYEPLDKLPDIHTVITVNNSADVGYSCFISCWFFDKTGKLLGVGNYED